jgi:ferredoxin
VAERARGENQDPTPRISPACCDGCGLCVLACPTRALGLKDGVALVLHPAACEYHGLCELACPRQAIERFFEIVDAIAEAGDRETPRRRGREEA